MRIGEICTRNVVFCPMPTTIIEAGALMRQYHVGNLVVIDERDGKRVPVGVITDRDIVVEVIGQNVPLEGVIVGDIMSRDITTAEESQDVFDALETMRHKGIRRMPVVDRDGVLVGIVALDDLLEILAEELGTMVKLISREQSVEAKARPARPGEPLPARH